MHRFHCWALCRLLVGSLLLVAALDDARYQEVHVLLPFSYLPYMHLGPVQRSLNWARMVIHLAFQPAEAGAAGRAERARKCRALLLLILVLRALVFTTEYAQAHAHGWYACVLCVHCNTTSRHLAQAGMYPHFKL